MKKSVPTNIWRSDSRPTANAAPVKVPNTRDDHVLVQKEVNEPQRRHSLGAICTGDGPLANDDPKIGPSKTGDLLSSHAHSL